MVTMGEFIRDTLMGPEEVTAAELSRDELIAATRAGSKEAGLQLLRSLAPKRSLDARHLPGKHNQKDHGHGHGHAAGGRVQGRDLTDELDYGAADQQVQDWAIEGRYGDGALGHILAKQGFDGLPGSGSSEDIDRLVADGHQELFRGWKDRPQQSAGEMQEQFRTGRLDPGYGVFGNGVYTAPNRSEAELYGSTQRMVLHKDAKVADYKSVIEEMSNRDDFDDSYSKSQVLQDPGRYAAAKGYDAIRYREEYEPGDVYEEVVVLNRTALTVQKGAEGRHLPGQHNQKDHGHGGGTAVLDRPKQRLTGEQYAAIQPGPGQTKAKALKALNATPEGQSLIEAATLWQDDMSAVSTMQKNFIARSNGKTLTRNADERVTALMDGIRNSPVSPPLHRGVRMPEGFDPKTALKPGTSFILPPSSFSSSERIGRGFAKQKVRGESVPVVYRVKAARGVPVEVFGHSSYKNEKEWISAGQFTVSSVSKGRDGVYTVDVHHTAMFSW